MCGKKFYEMDGNNLKAALADNGITPAELSKKMGKGIRTVYDYFNKQKIKPVILKKISIATCIPVEELTKEVLQVNEPETPNYGVVHHGKNVLNVIKSKDMKIEAFIKKMNLTRGTVYKRFKVKEWDKGELLKAAEILNVPVALLQGDKNAGQELEKLIYKELRAIKMYLKQIHQKVFAE